MRRRGRTLGTQGQRTRASVPLRVAAFFALVGCLWTSPASARSEATSRYTLKQTYSAALRYLRVDLGFEVVEKDPEAAYLLFKYRPSEGKAESHGTLELVENTDKVMVYVTLAKFPRYHEEILSDGLLKKLKDEYGAPPEPEPEPEPPKEPPAEEPPSEEPREPKERPKDEQPRAAD